MDEHPISLDAVLEDKPATLPIIAINHIPEISPRRIKIYFQDEGIRSRSHANAQQLLSSAMVSSTTNNSSLVAKKALKYRKVLDRMTGIDIYAPEFDASKFLGVDWCKTSSLKAYCMREQ